MARRRIGLKQARDRKTPATKGAGTATAESILVVLAYLAFAYAATGGRPATVYDAFRDMAYAHGILAGGLGRDPMLAGLPAWYPPGNPLAFALLSRLTGVSVNTLYTTSVFWLGWANPLVLFWLARLSWGRLAAWLALPCVLLGSRWWLANAAAQMPSVQGVGLALATLIAWRQSRDGNRVALSAATVLGALTTWVHPLCGAFALGTVALHGVLAPVLAAREPGEHLPASRLAVRALGVAFAGGLLALPALQISLHGPILNIAPRHWFSPQLHDARFVLHAYSPLIWIPGAAGIAMAWREWRQHGWLAVWFLLGLVGMLAGYAGHDLGWRVPWLIPHEFQWHAQLALTLAAALAMARWAGNLAERTNVQAPRRVGWAVILLILAVGPASFALATPRRSLMVLDERWLGIVAIATQLREQLPPDAVIAAPPDASYLIAGLTGLHVIAVPAGHANPAVDVIARVADAESLLTTGDSARFASLIQKISSVLRPVAGRAGEAAGRGGRDPCRWPALEPIKLPVPKWRAYRVSGNIHGSAR